MNGQTTNVTVLKDEALGSIGREYREVKRKAEVGELVRMSAYYVHGYKGEILRVCREDNGVVHFEGRPFNGEGTPYIPSWSGGNLAYVVLEPTDIVHDAGGRYRMVERAAAKGERILITNSADERYGNGDTFVVRRLDEDGDVRVDGNFDDMYVGEGEYHVLVPVGGAVPYDIPRANLERATTYLPVDSAPTDPAVQSVIDELTALVSNLSVRLTAVEREVTVLRKPNKPAGGPVVDKALDAVILPGETAVPAAAVTRDAVIERAKADVAGLLRTNRDVPFTHISFWPKVDGEVTYWIPMQRVEFVVNRKKRTVVALIRYLPEYEGGSVWARGIAKCAPGDVFNTHIGRAIALRRALGLTVPGVYLNAPQPTEVHVGDLIRNWQGRSIPVRADRSDADGLSLSYVIGCGYPVIDDSREDNGEASGREAA